MHRNLLKLFPITFILLASAVVVISDSSEAVGTHQVSFNVNGGQGVATSMTVADGDDLELPSALFTRTGYYLTGWNTTADGTGTGYAAGDSVTIRNDLTLYAQWSPLPSGFEYISDASSVIDQGQTYTFSAPTENRPDGDSTWYPWYYFTSHTSAYGGVDVTVDESAAPRWIELTRDEDSHSNTFSGSTLEPGVYLVCYTCTMVTSSSIGGSSEQVSKVCWTVTVRSDSDTYGTITFDMDDGSGSIAQISGRLGTVVSLPGEGATSKSGYMLAGWSIPVREGTGTFALGSYFVLDGNYTATAVWLPTANVVILDGSGQIGNQIDAFVGYNNETITLPSSGYEKDGASFAGWRLSSDPDTIYALGYIYTIQGPTYMVAYYVPDSAAKCNVTFSANGGTGTLNQTVEAGMSIVLPVHGFSSETDLEGWTDQYGQIYEPGDVVEVSEDMTFSAVWGTSAPSVVTVVFDLNGGSGSAATQILDNGDYAVEPPTPTKAGCIFVGWDVVGGGRFDFSEPVDHSITLRAAWETLFTRTYSNNIVIIEMAPAYAGSPTTVDWGDGTTSTGTISFTHDYGKASSGTITVTTQYGAQGQTLTSSISYSVSGPGGSVPVPDSEPEDSDGLPIWMIIVVVLIAFLVIVTWRILS